MGRKSGLPKVFLRNDSGIYWCSFTVDGKRYRLATGERDRGTAQQTAATFFTEASKGIKPATRKPKGHAAKTALKELATAYIEWAEASGKAPSYVVKQIMHFRAHFQPRWKRASQISQQEIERYIVERTRDGTSNITIHKELVTLSKFLKWARKNNHITEVPVFERVSQVSEHKPVDLTPVQSRALLAQLPDRAAHPKHIPVRELFTVQWAQALRPGEAMSLTWDEIDLAQKRITIRLARDKARAGRVIGMAPEAFKVLDSLSKRPHKAADLVFGKGDYRVSLRAAAGRAGLPEDITPHTFRHARLSELASQTRDVAAVQYFAGHKHLATTDKYVRSRTERTEVMLKAMIVSRSRRSGRDRKGRA